MKTLQLNKKAIEKMDADVLIIGAGPAGSMAARMLKKLGRQAVILEKEQFPRFSIGESLLPHCMEFLEEADLLGPVAAESFQLKNGAAFSHAGKLTEFDFSQKFTAGWTTTYQVPRARFDQILAEAAEDCGVPIHYRHSIVAADFNTPGQSRLTSVDANGVRRDWTASMVMDASGFGRVLPRLLNLETPSPLPPRQALFTHIEDRIAIEGYDRNKILIAIHPKFHEVWYWLIPFSNGRSSLGVVMPMGFLETRTGHPLEILQELAMEEPRLAALLKESCFDTPANRIGGYSANVKRLYGDGFVLLGNAGEFLDPVFSSGVTIALKSASLAVPLVDRQLCGLPVDWQASYEEILRRGIDVFRAYVEAWYDGRLQRLIFEDRQLASVKAMICSILAGFAWDDANPMTQRCGKKIEAIAGVCPPLLLSDVLTDTKVIRQKPPAFGMACYTATQRKTLGVILPMASLNLRIADDMKQQLDALAEATGRNKSFLAVEAIRDYLQREAWQVDEIRQAVQEADAGDFADESEVKAVRDKWLNDAG